MTKKIHLLPQELQALEHGHLHAGGKPFKLFPPSKKAKETKMAIGMKSSQGAGPKAQVEQEAAQMIAKALAPMLVEEVAKVSSQTLATTAQGGEATTTVKHPDGSETSVVEAVGKPKLFSGPVCEVTLSGGLTLNLGNYQSARLDVGVKIPCAHAELNQVYEFAKTWVDTKLQALSKDYGADAKG